MLVKVVYADESGCSRRYDELYIGSQTLANLLNRITTIDTYSNVIREYIAEELGICMGRILNIEFYS